MSGEMVNELCAHTHGNGTSLVPTTKFKFRQRELEAAWAMSSPQLRKALRTQLQNIRRFCERQRPKEWTRKGNGISAGQVVRPLESVGCYVPGGRHPLVSTLLMTVIPAQVAGVRKFAWFPPIHKMKCWPRLHMLGVRESFTALGERRPWPR